MSLFSEDWLKSAQDDRLPNLKEAYLKIKKLCISFCYIQRYNYLYRKEVTICKPV